MKLGEIAPVVAAVQAAEPVQARHEVADRRRILAAIKELELPELELPNRGLNIAYDRDTRQNVVQIVDRDSGEVVQQIPGKEVVERAKYYREISGL